MTNSAEAALLALAPRLTAVTVDMLVDLPDELDLDEDAYNALSDGVMSGLEANPGAADPAARQEAELIAGALVHASVFVTGLLFEDYRILVLAEESGARVNFEDLAVLRHLPPRYRHRYDREFVQRFIVAFAELTARLHRFPWEEPSSTAQEIGLRIIVAHVGYVAEAAGVKLRDDWRDRLNELLFGDLDHELLYDPQMDGVEDGGDLHEQLRLPSMGYEAWFSPVDSDYTVPPLFAVAGPEVIAGGPIPPQPGGNGGPA